MLLSLAACVGTDDPTIVSVAAKAGEPALLEAEPGADSLVHRWEVIKAPDGTEPRVPAGGASVEFTPPRRGTYVIDHWLEDRFSQYLTDHFVITASGAPPVAQLARVSTGTVGTTITFDGTASRSPEGLPLQFAWRLATRPRGSVAELTTLDTPTTMLTLDVAGAYDVQLEVFDGEQWSEVARTMFDAI